MEPDPRAAQAAHRGVGDPTGGDGGTPFTEPTPPAAFRSLDVPVLYMVGKQSQPSARAVARRLATALPRVEVLEHLGHMGPVTHPDVVREWSRDSSSAPESARATVASLGVGFEWMPAVHAIFALKRSGIRSVAMATVPRLPHAFLDGVRCFNSGEYFEAHEVFEELLDAVEADGRWELLVALIQVAVGYHKCASNHAGGRVMLEKGLAKLVPFADDAGGVAVGTLRSRVEADVAALDAGASGGGILAAPPRITLVTGDWSTGHPYLMQGGRVRKRQG